jgi:hypothetical protein
MADPVETGLSDLATALEWPAASPGFAAQVVAHLDAGARRGGVPWPGGFAGRSFRRSLLGAVAALLLLAAAAAAVGIVLPGLRVVFVPADDSGGPVSPRMSAPLGSPLGLGTRVDLDEAADIVNFVPLLPAGVGDPDEAHVANDRLTLLWHSRGSLVPIDQTAVGLLLTEIRGTVDPGYFEKQVEQGATTVEPVLVGDDAGYWVTGEPHALVYRGADGNFHEETRRVVGDVLIWRRGELTLRLESALGRDATIALAESVAPAP